MESCDLKHTEREEACDYDWSHVFSGLGDADKIRSDNNFYKNGSLAVSPHNKYSQRIPPGGRMSCGGSKSPHSIPRVMWCHRLLVDIYSCCGRCDDCIDNNFSTHLLCATDPPIVRRSDYGALSSFLQETIESHGSLSGQWLWLHCCDGRWFPSTIRYYIVSVDDNNLRERGSLPAFYR